jgi:hypothetical protein
MKGMYVSKEVGAGEGTIGIPAKVWEQARKDLLLKAYEVLAYVKDVRLEKLDKNLALKVSIHTIEAHEEGQKLLTRLSKELRVQMDGNGPRVYTLDFWNVLSYMDVTASELKKNSDLVADVYAPWYKRDKKKFGYQMVDTLVTLAQYLKDNETEINWMLTRGREVM